MSKSITATATVELSVIVRASGAWGNDCTVEQINKQARESAMNALRRAVESSGGKFRILGKPAIVKIEIKSND